jgi:hypothetical protein
LERTNEDWAKWQLCRYAEVATEVMCYAISRATNPATTPEAYRPATFGHFLETAKHLAGMAELDTSGADQIGLFERWQKNNLRYLVPETGEVFNMPRRSFVA